MAENETTENETTENETTDPRLEEVQEEVDQVRARIPKNPGLTEPDPDVRPIMPDEEDTNPPL